MDRDLIRETRRCLNSVPKWIEDEDYRNSRSHYGCPPRLYPLLNRPINEEPTCTDLLAWAARQLGHPITYLEIGVSVGKSLYALANVLEDAQLVGFDWEPINPSLERRFERMEGPGRYACGSNRVTYVQGDVFRREDWRRLAGRTFNLIFSDAVHRGEAILREFAMMQEFDLIDERAFVMVWDDLENDPESPMTRAFWEIAGAMKARHGLGDDRAFLVEVNGWLGQHEYRHTVGLINNIGLRRADLP